MGAKCGCPGVENKFTFCPEDDLNKKFPCFLACLPFKLSLFTIITFLDAAYDLSTRELGSDYFYTNFSPLSYCGCETPPNVCKICSNKQVLAKPGKILMFVMISLVKGLKRLLCFSGRATAAILLKAWHPTLVNAWILLPMSLSRGGEQVHILSRG
jgi:hypothetical protein